MISFPVCVCICVQHFLYPFICWWTFKFSLGCYVLTIKNNAQMTMEVQILTLQDTDFIFFKYMRSFQKLSSYVIWKIDTLIEEDTRHKKHCTQDNDASVPFKVDTLGPHTVLPIAISFPVVFSWISLTVWNLFPFKGGFRFGKSQKLQGAQSGL